MELTSKLQDNVDVLHSFKNAPTENKLSFSSRLLNQNRLRLFIVSRRVVDGDEISGRFQKYQAMVLKISGPIKTYNSFILLTCWVGSSPVHPCHGPPVKDSLMFPWHHINIRINHDQCKFSSLKTSGVSLTSNQWDLLYYNYLVTSSSHNLLMCSSVN